VIVLVTLTVGLVVWITAWAFGVKAFDAFLFTAVITVMAAGARIALPYVEEVLHRPPPRPGER
jgi:hypothetical protein